MYKHRGQMGQQELSLEELELSRLLEFRLPQFTLKSLAKDLYATEEQVRACLKNLGLLEVVSEGRVAERRKVKALARRFYADLARSAREFYDDKLAG